MWTNLLWGSDESERCLMPDDWPDKWDIPMDDLDCCKLKAGDRLILDIDREPNDDNISREEIDLEVVKVEYSIGISEHKGRLKLKDNIVTQWVYLKEVI